MMKHGNLMSCQHLPGEHAGSLCFNQNGLLEPVGNDLTAHTRASCVKAWATSVLYCQTLWARQASLACAAC